MQTGNILSPAYHMYRTNQYVPDIFEFGDCYLIYFMQIYIFYQQHAFFCKIGICHHCMQNSHCGCQNVKFVILYMSMPLTSPLFPALVYIQFTSTPQVDLRYQYLSDSSIQTKMINLLPSENKQWRTSGTDMYYICGMDKMSADTSVKKCQQT